MNLDKSQKNFMHKNAFLSFLTLFYWADTFNSARTTFSYYDRIAITTIILAVLLTQALFLKALSLKLNSRYATNIAYGILIALNTFTLSLSQMENYIQASLFFKVIIMLVVVFVASSLLNLMDEIKGARLWILSIILLPLAATAIRPVLPEITKLWIPPPSISELKNFKHVEFQKKPNVYITFFDGLIPQSIVKKYLSLEKVEYGDVLNNNFYKFKNFFVDAAPSMESINKFLALDKSYFDDLSGERIELFGGLVFKTHRKHELFQGNTESPLIEIFKQNGYETSTVFGNGFFGVKKGLHVDNYFVKQKFSACDYVHQATKGIAFFGYCNLSSNPEINRLLNIQPNIDYIIDKFRKGLSKNKPQFFVTYVRTPGHTPLSYDHNKEGAVEKYSKLFLERSKLTASHIKRYLDFVKNEDPSGFVYLLGDHGTWLSRESSYKDEEEFFVLDRYAVYGGFYPPDKCRESLSNPYSPDYMTAIQGIHMVIRCLSGGKNAFVELDEYRISGKSYSEYLYE